MNQPAPQQCDKCGAVLVWRPEGISRQTGMPYDGFWSGPNYKQHPKGQSAGYPKPVAVPPQTPQVAPGRPIVPPMALEARERSIQAQACAKASCEAFAGAGMHEADMTAQHDWIVKLTLRLIDVVDGAANGREEIDDFLGR